MRLKRVQILNIIFEKKSIFNYFLINFSSLRIYIYILPLIRKEDSISCLCLKLDNENGRIKETYIYNYKPVSK